ncbi:MAG TPA: LamG domain-containing protein [Candidatus Nanoarchaeia archaeon]|nr:LamG domain-containing protein [Candidatus Nanoarchaeia archaeon]
MKKLNSISNRILTGLAAIVLGATPSKAQYQPDANTVALYHFDEGKGTIANDSSQYENHATIEGAQWIDGFFGGALEFDGTTTKVTIPETPSLNLGTFTIEARVRFSEGYRTNHRMIISKTSSQGNNNFQLYWTRDYFGSIGVYYDVNGQGQRIGLFFNPEPGNWHHIAGSYDSHEQYQLKLWLDHSLVAWNSVIYYPDTTTAQTRIGYLQVPGSPISQFHFKGTIDEVRISNIERDFSTTSVPEDYPSMEESTWGRVKKTFK